MPPLNDIITIRRVRDWVPVLTFIVVLTLTWASLTNQVGDVEKRVSVLEMVGSAPLRALRDSVLAVREDQRVMRWLQCQPEPMRYDSFCIGLTRPDVR